MRATMQLGKGVWGGGGRRGSRPLVGEDKRGLGIAVVERSVAISQVQALAVCNWQTDLKRILKWIPTEIGDKRIYRSTKRGTTLFFYMHHTYSILGNRFILAMGRTTRASQRPTAIMQLLKNEGGEN